MGVQSLGREDPLEEGMAIHSSILAWEIPWIKEPGGLQLQGCKESVTTERLNNTIHRYRHRHFCFRSRGSTLSINRFKVGKRFKVTFGYPAQEPGIFNIPVADANCWLTGISDCPVFTSRRAIEIKLFPHFFHALHSLSALSSESPFPKHIHLCEQIFSDSCGALTSDPPHFRCPKVIALPGSAQS